MKNASQTAVPVTRLTLPVSERDHVQGLATAAVTLVEYGDYQSAECAAAQSWIKTLQAQMGDRLRLVFRHFPASSLPPHAAEAAEAAGLQDRFWEMHYTLFAHPLELGNGHLVEYAQSLGLDTSRFLRDMTSHVSAERLRLDRVSGIQSGVRDTPAFFVNGVRQCPAWNGGGLWQSVLMPARITAPEVAEDLERWADDGAPLILNPFQEESVETRDVS